VVQVRGGGVARESVEAELRVQSEEFEPRMDALMKSHKKQLDEMSGNQSEEAERFKSSISGLEQQLQSLSAQPKPIRRPFKEKPTSSTKTPRLCRCDL
jgi:hypothetical protein